MKATMLLVLLATGLVPGLAQAQTVVRGPDKTVYRQHTTIDVGEVMLKGMGDAPSLPLVLVHAQTKFPSLIRLRSSFTPELSKSIEQL